MLKSNIAWMKKNVPSDLKVWKGMIQDIDWSQVAAKAKLSLQRDKDRITAEFKEFAAMDTSAKIDWLMNGDRHLGYLYKKDAIAFARREWKGLKSVGYDFVGWLKIWGGMLNMVMKDPMSIMLAVFEYHWFASYLATPAVVDRSVFGRRGKLLQADFDIVGRHYPLGRGSDRQPHHGGREDWRQREDQQAHHHVRRNDDGADDGRLPEPARHPVPDDPGLHGLRNGPADPHPVHRRHRELRPPVRYLPAADG